MTPEDLKSKKKKLSTMPGRGPGGDIRTQAQRPTYVTEAVPVAGPQQINVTVNQPESPTLAIVTLIAYLFLYPVGLILNVVGLFTGPKRGCFVWMFFVFFVLPGIVLLVLLALGFFATGMESGL